MNALPELPDDRLIELEDFVRNEVLDDKVCYPVARTFIPKAHAESVGRGDERIAFGLLKVASAIMHEPALAGAALRAR